MIEYRLISADSHFVEPPAMWAQRVDKRFRDRAPHAIRLHDQPGEYFVCESLAPVPIYKFFSAGVPESDYREFIKRGFDEAPRAVHDPAERIKDQDRDGVVAEVIYTSMGLPLFGIGDAELRAACFHAFNDWATDYCSYDFKRLIALGLLTLEDIPAAVAELERIKKRGMAGALIWGEAPEDRPYSHPDYDPLWAAAQDLKMPLSLHTHTDAAAARGRSVRLLTGLTGVERTIEVISMVHSIERSLTQIVCGGALERYPGLTIISAENNVGWIPFFLFRMDRTTGRHRDLNLKMKASDYVKRQVYATFIDDPVFVDLLNWFPADNIMWSSDYPHLQASFPHSQEYVAQHLGRIAEVDRRKIVHDTAARIYGLN